MEMTIDIFMLIVALVVVVILFITSLTITIKTVRVEHRHSLPSESKVYKFVTPAQNTSVSPIQNSPVVCSIESASNPPAFEAIPVDVYGIPGPGGVGLTPANPPNNLTLGWSSNLEVPRHVWSLPVCTNAVNRGGGPDNLQVTDAGEVNFDMVSVTNANPLGGYIMTSEHSGMDHTLPMSRVPYTTALSQSEVDNGDTFSFFPSFPQLNSIPHNLELHLRMV